MSLGKAGGALMADVEALGRLISLALRSGIPIKEIYRQLRGISSDRVIGLGPNKILSVPDAVGIAIERWMQEKQGIQQELLPGAPASAEPAPVVAQRTAGRRARRRADRARRHAGDAVGRLPGLRLAAGVRRGVREVPRVRLQRVRVIVVFRLRTSSSGAAQRARHKGDVRWQQIHLKGPGSCRGSEGPVLRTPSIRVPSNG